MTNQRPIVLLLALLASTVSGAQETTLPPVKPPYYRAEYAPGTTPGELVYGVSYTVWIPPGVDTVRGIIVHQHGCGEGACKAGQTAAFDLHWQALAAKHQCGLLGPSYQQPEKADCGLWCDPRHGSNKRFMQALEDLAQKSGHPELARVPWALWGHSGGAKWVGTMLMLHPDRIVAVWLRSGSPALGAPAPGSKLPQLEIPEAAYRVPLMSNLGTKEGVTDKEGRFAKVWPNTQALFKELRGKGALMGVAVDPKSSHDCGNSRYLAIPWFDACLEARLPQAAGQPLKPMPTNGAWLAPVGGETARPAAQYVGEAKEAVWLPNERVARAWAEYVKDGDVSDTTPPPAPTHVRVTPSGELTWDAPADLESGIGGFIIERDGRELARVPEKPAGRIGRSIFQRNSYSDTPEQPLAVMRYVDATARTGERAEYRVSTVNSVGLKSAAVVAVPVLAGSEAVPAGRP